MCHLSKIHRFHGVATGSEALKLFENLLGTRDVGKFYTISHPLTPSSFKNKWFLSAYAKRLEILSFGPHCVAHSLAWPNLVSAMLSQLKNDSRLVVETM